MKGSSLGHPGSGRVGEKEETHPSSPAGETYSAVLWGQPRQLNWRSMYFLIWANARWVEKNAPGSMFQQEYNALLEKESSFSPA